MRARMSTHAIARWKERIGGIVPRAVEGVLLPYRFVRTTSRWHRLTSKTGRQTGFKHIFTPSALVLVHGGQAVTVIATHLSDLATVLVWLMTHYWIPDDGFL